MADPPSDPTGAGTNLKHLLLLRLFVIGVLMLLLALPRSLLDTGASGQALLALIVVLGAISLWTWKQLKKKGTVSDSGFLAQLVIDVLVLTAILYSTGGASNPFAWVYLIPLSIAASVLSAAASWSIAALTVLCYSYLMFGLPTPAAAHAGHDQAFSQHLLGMWFGFVLSATLVAWLVSGMARTMRRRERLLAEAREKTLRDEQLVALATLATGAAHELGTPLATMAVVTGELVRQDGLPAHARGQLQILRAQIDRCKEALSVISASAGESRAEGGGVVSADRFLRQVMRQWQAQRPQGLLETDIADDTQHACILAERTLQQALVNLLNNAADASPRPVLLRAYTTADTLLVEILDHGPGPCPDTLAELGRQRHSDKDYGLGLGLFLTYATVQRLGGDVRLFEREGGGTRTHLSLPLHGAGPK